MIKVFVTVGTTAFDELVEAIDLDCGCQEDLDITVQVSTASKYNTMNVDSFDFSNSFHSYVDEADVVVTHAGAGSVYSMLEKGKKLIVIPNLSRVDQHQQELANYVGINNLALTTSSLDNLCKLIRVAYKKNFKVYEKDDFFGAEIIKALLK